MWKYIIIIVVCLACTPRKTKCEYYKEKKYKLVRIENGKATFIVPKHPRIGTTIYVEETVDISQ